MASAQIEQNKANDIRQEQNYRNGLVAADNRCPSGLVTLKSQFASVIDQPVDMRSGVPNTVPVTSPWLYTIGDVSGLHNTYGKLDQATVDNFLASVSDYGRFQIDFMTSTNAYGGAFKMVSDIDSGKWESQRAFLGRAKFNQVVVEMRRDAAAKRQAAIDAGQKVITQYQATCALLGQLHRQLP